MVSRKTKMALLTSLFVVLLSFSKDATKVFFLALFYSTLLPSGFIMCGLTLSVYYIVDKYCITRIWKPAPLTGTELTKFSRKVFFTLGKLFRHFKHTFPCATLFRKRRTACSILSVYHTFCLSLIKAFLALCLMTAYWLSGFPYDNLCACDSREGNGCDEVSAICFFTNALLVHRNIDLKHFTLHNRNRFIQLGSINTRTS